MEPWPGPKGSFTMARAPLQSRMAPQKEVHSSKEVRSNLLWVPSVLLREYNQCMGKILHLSA